MSPALDITTSSHHLYTLVLRIWYHLQIAIRFKRIPVLLLHTLFFGGIAPPHRRQCRYIVGEPPWSISLSKGTRSHQKACFLSLHVPLLKNIGRDHHHLQLRSGTSNQKPILNPSPRSWCWNMKPEELEMVLMALLRKLNPQLKMLTKIESKATPQGLLFSRRIQFTDIAIKPQRTSGWGFVIVCFKSGRGMIFWFSIFLFRFGSDRVVICFGSHSCFDFPMICFR